MPHDVVVSKTISVLSADETAQAIADALAGLPTNPPSPTNPAVYNFVSPSDFGALGDGVANDFDALKSCIEDGSPIEWGDASKVYRIESPIDLSIGHGIDWRSNGATIKYEGPYGAYVMVRLSIQPKVHRITGHLTFDSNNKSGNGLFITNHAAASEGPHPSIIMTDTRAINVRRSVLSHGSCSGISVYGDWQDVFLIRPYVKNVKMNAAAINPGVAGIAGITVSRISAEYPRRVVVVDPYVENVFCDDGSQDNDQDGIVLFSRVNEGAGSNGDTSQIIVRGGTIKNARGRSIKGQARNVSVSGVTVVKQAGVVIPGVSGISSEKADIELQTGDGSVSDIYFALYGYTCQDLIRVYPASNINSAPSTVNGVRGAIVGVLPRALVTMIQKTSGRRVGFTIDNVNILGSCEMGVLVSDAGAAATGIGSLQLSNISATFTTALVVGSNALVPSGRVNICNASNDGATVPRYSGNASWTIQAVNTNGLS